MKQHTTTCDEMPSSSLSSFQNEERCSEILDIIQHMKQREAQEESVIDDGCYPRKERFRKSRPVLVEWMYENEDVLRLNHAVVPAATYYLDAITSSTSSSSSVDDRVDDTTGSLHIATRSEYQLACLTCLHISMKLYDERCKLQTMEELLNDYSGGCTLYTEKDVLQMECNILQTLAWKVYPLTTNCFLEQYVQYLLLHSSSSYSYNLYDGDEYDEDEDKKEDEELEECSRVKFIHRIQSQCQKLLRLVNVHNNNMSLYRYNDFKPSMLAYAAMLLSIQELERQRQTYDEATEDGFYVLLNIQRQISELMWKTSLSDDNKGENDILAKIHDAVSFLKQVQLEYDPEYQQEKDNHHHDSSIAYEEEDATIATVGTTTATEEQSRNSFSSGSMHFYDNFSQHNSSHLVTVDGVDLLVEEEEDADMNNDDIIPTLPMSPASTNNSTKKKKSKRRLWSSMTMTRQDANNSRIIKSLQLGTSTSSTCAVSKEKQQKTERPTSSSLHDTTKVLPELVTPPRSARRLGSNISKRGLVKKVKSLRSLFG